MSDSPASDTPSLSVSGGPHDGRSIEIQQDVELVLGSGANAHFRLEAGNIDADHAHLRWDERGVLLSDFGSSTGSYVNGERISTDHPLKDGDRVFLGPPGSKQSVRLVVRIPEVTAGPALELDAPAAPMVEDEPLILEDEPPPPVVIFDEPPVALTPAPPPPPPAPAPPPPVAKPAPAADAVAPPAPAATKPSEPRKPKPEYSMDMPSMVPTDRVREPMAVPAVIPAPMPKARPAVPSFSLAAVPRPVIVGVVTAVVVAGAFMVYRSQQKPPPVLSAVQPARIEEGGTIRISGDGFTPDPEGNVVRVGDQTAKVTSASATEIAATVPELAISGGAQDIPVVVESHRSKSNSLFVKVFVLPVITSLEPDVAMPGEEVVAKGKNLGGTSSSVLVGSQPAELVSGGPNELRFRVPTVPAAAGHAVPVQVRVGAEVGRASNLYLGKLPLLIEASPARGQAGDRVTVRGRGLDPTPGATTLSFGNAQALVLSTTPTEVVAIVPGLSEGQVVLPISATVHGAISSGVVRYTLARPASTTFVPRFFAAPVTDAGHAGHDHALVANELGPVLLLSGKADAPSTAERAERAATALNTVTEALLAGKTGGVELQDKPAPGLSATGGASPFVTATAADVAGYQESWEASAPRPSRYGPRELVGYWAALLQDELALFAKRQRPAALIELSPRAKIFNDLYAEAARRVGRGGGVPLAVVSPLTPTLARGFHDLAFLLPTEAARPGAAVEGRWSGTMVEGEAGQRNVDLKLRSQSGGLGGTMTATSGKLAMEIPLKEASYEKGTLRFVLVVGGAPKHFVGNVEGDAISGTIHASADAKEAIGRFSLKYTQ